MAARADPFRRRVCAKISHAQAEVVRGERPLECSGRASRAALILLDGPSMSDSSERGVEDDALPAARSDGWQRLGAFLRDRYLRVDVRWLGVFRIALGTLLMVEVLRRWYYARAFYTNDGLLPNHYSLFAPMGRNVFSIYHAFSSYGEVSVAFLLTLLVFFAFTLGYRTKLFHVLSAVCITSLNARNLFVENGGTVVVNILTLYTLFLPLGARFSLDAVRESLKRRRDASVADLNRPDPLNQPETATSLVVLLLLVQWSCIYFFNTVQKDGEGWRNGSALYWFFQQDRIVTWFGVWAREHLSMPLIRVMTYGALCVEGSLSVLILFPFAQKWTRRAVLLLVWTLHGFIALSARIGPFSYAMMLFPLLLLGSEDFAWVTRAFRSPERLRRVVIAAESPFLFAFARVLDRVDPFDRLVFVDRRQAELVPADAPRAAFLVVTSDGGIHRHAAALRELTRALPFGIVLRGLSRVPGLAGALERFAEQLDARHRRWGRAIGVRQRGEDPATARRAAVLPVPALGARLRELSNTGRDAAVALLGVAVVAAILDQNPFVSRHLHVTRAEWMIELVEYPRLLQGWSMFAPEPPYEDGRVVVDGRTADGRHFDPFADGVPNFDPYAPNGWGHSQFWCDYHNRIRFGDNAHHRQHLRDYLLRQHELSGHPENRLVAFDVWWVSDRSPPPGVAKGEPLPPEKLLSYGKVEDSGAAPRLGPLEAKRVLGRGPEAPLHGP
jgi:hypothetical protein